MTLTFTEGNSFDGSKVVINWCIDGRQMIQTFPCEILFLVFTLLELDDLLNVSMTCKILNAASSHFVYQKLYLTWKEIEDIASKQYDDDERLKVVRAIKIESDGRGEWTSSSKLPMVSRLISESWETLHIACAMRSSGWLKYLGEPMSRITTMILTNSGCSQNFTFDFSHITETMPNLETISLGDSRGGFLLDPYSEGGLKHLRRLKVENCEWEYPARLSDATQVCELETLEIVYSKHMHPFTFSERLKSEFKSLPKSLVNLKIDICVGAIVNWNPLERSSPLMNLRTARLRGFNSKFQADTKCSAYRKFPKLEELSES